MNSFLRGAALAASILVFLNLLGASAGLYELSRGTSWTMAAVAALSFIVVMLTGPKRGR